MNQARVPRVICHAPFTSILTTALGILWISTAPAAVRLAAQQAAGPADLILSNGKVVTVDANFSIVQAVAVRGNQVAATGSDADIMKLAGPNTLVIDLKGRTVVPGLIDTHSHIYNYAETAYGNELGEARMRRFLVDWRGVNTKEDLLNQLRNLKDKYHFKPGEWIYFADQLGFISSGTFEQAKILYDEMNRRELDKVFPDNPIALTLGIPDLNGFLLNSKAMDIIWKNMNYAAFIKKYGRYWIDASAQPEGHIEPPASRIVNHVIGGGAPEDLGPIYKKYMEEWSAIGVTTVSTRMPEYAENAYHWLDARGEMPLRIGYGLLDYFGTVKDVAREMPTLSQKIGTGTDFFWVTSAAPTAVDGATTRACTSLKRSGGAYGVIDSWFPQGQCHLDVEYRGAKAKGAPISGNYFREWVNGSGKYGVRFANTHVAGDRSNAMLLNLMEDLKTQYGPQAIKGWAFDHCSMVNPADLPKAGKLGVTYSCLVTNIRGADSVAKSYGDDVANTYLSPINSMLKNGAKAVFEMDHDGYTWADLEVFITRKDSSGKVWGPQEKVDHATALKMITRWAADYVLKADKLGSLEPGKLADIVVLNQDYLSVSDEKVRNTHSMLTIVGGSIMHVHPEFAQEYNLRPKSAIIATYEELKARRKPFGFSGAGG